MDAASLAVPVPRLDPLVLARFAAAGKAWIDEGATWIDLPWQVPAEFTRATRPLFCHGRDVETPHGTLLASGEQAFLWLDAQRRLPATCLVGWTPCFRDEPVLDDWHQYGFIKLEAYRPLDGSADPQVELLAMVDRAQRHFRCWAAQDIVRRPLADGTIDLELNGHEVGSYGIRRHPTLTSRQYVYGTVLAEPRFSMATSARSV